MQLRSLHENHVAMEESPETLATADDALFFLPSYFFELSSTSGAPLDLSTEFYIVAPSDLYGAKSLCRVRFSHFVGCVCQEGRNERRKKKLTGGVDGCPTVASLINWPRPSSIGSTAEETRPRRPVWSCQTGHRERGKEKGPSIAYYSIGIRVVSRLPPLQVRPARLNSMREEYGGVCWTRRGGNPRSSWAPTRLPSSSAREQMFLVSSFLLLFCFPFLSLRSLFASTRAWRESFL